MANNVGTLVIAPIRPQSTADVFPTAVANEISGGWHSYPTYADLVSIPTERIAGGMAAYVQADNAIYVYKSGIWEVLTVGMSGSGGGDVSYLTSRVNEISASLFVVRNDVATISGNLNTLSGDVAELSNTVVNLTNTVNTISGNLDTLEATVQNVETNITAINSDLNTLETTIISVSGTLATNYYTKTDSDNRFVHLTGNENIAGNKTFNNNVTVLGDLNVSGTLTYLDSTNLAISDNVIVLNRGEVGAGVTNINAGLTVERGSLPDSNMVFNEVSDRWMVGTGDLSANPPLTAIALLTDVATVSGALLDEINSSQGDIASLTSSVSTLAITSVAHEIRITNLESTVTDLTASFGTLMQGTVACSISANLYTINHATVNINTSFPVVSLTVPTSGSTLYVQGILDRTPTNFKVVLSGIPEVTGYAINWQMNLSGSAFVVKTYDVQDLVSTSAISASPTNVAVDASSYDNAYLALQGHANMLLPLNMANGQSINIVVKQNASPNNWQLFFDPAFEFSGGTPPTATTGSGATTVFTVLKVANRYFVSYLLDFN